MKALIIGMGIGELYRSVYTNLGWDIVTCDTVKPADFNSVEEITGEYDIAHVCTPNFTHENIARSIAEFCKIVFVEKPGVENKLLWQSLVDTFPNTRFAMVKNNQFRSNTSKLHKIAQGSDFIELCWLNKNRVPHPGSWFTTKKLAYGGVSRDLLPHLLSWVQVLHPFYTGMTLSHSETHQNYTLEDLENTEYGEINMDGTYDVDDSARIVLKDGHRVFSCEAAWKCDTIKDNVALYFYNKTKLIHKEELGLCPEEAYKEMVDSAWKNVYNDAYWKKQLMHDIWIHQQLQDM